MKKGVRIAGVLWSLGGLALCACTTWSLAAQGNEQSAVASWLVAFAFGALAITGGLLTMRLRSIGRYLLALASLLSLLYVSIYFLFGGIDDAASYLPAVVAMFALSVYALAVFLQAKVQAN